MIDGALQCASVILLLYGSWESGSLRSRAILAKLAGSTVTFVVATIHFIPGIMVLNAVLFTMQVRNLIRWRRNGVPW